MDGLTTDDLNSGNYLSTLRNKAIANHFNMLGEIEKYGSGVSRVIGLFQEAGLPVPVIEEICGGIRVTVRKAGARNTEKDADRVTGKVTEKVTENQRKILSFVAIFRKRLSNSWHFYSDQHGEAQDPCLLLLDSTAAGQGIFKVPVQDCREKR